MTIALPHNLDAEQAVLGALLFDNRLMGRLHDLRSEHFYDPAHGRIFAEAKRLIDVGQRADGIRMRDWAAADGGMEALGGAVYLLDLLNSSAKLTPQAIDYALMIRELSARREIFRACQDAARLALKGETEPKEIVRQAEQALGAIGFGGRVWLNLRDAADEVLRNLEKPEPSGIKTGLAKIDALVKGGLCPSDLVIVAGRPSMGKTALADVLANNAADAGKVVGFFSMEMTPEQIAARTLSRHSASTSARFGYSELRGHARPRAEVVRPLAERLSRTLLIDPTGAQTLGGIEASARDMRAKSGKLDLILVDYLQLMRDSQARKDGRTQEVSEITAGLKLMAKRLNVPVVALSQLSRAVENRADKTPQLSDLRESGSIEQDADVVLFVYREHYYLERNPPQPKENEQRADFSVRMAAHELRLRDTAHEFKLICAKNRHGGCGVAELWCDLSMDVILDEPLSRRALER